MSVNIQKKVYKGMPVQVDIIKDGTLLATVEHVFTYEGEVFPLEVWNLSENKYGFYVLKEGRIIIKFFLINNIMYYQKNFPIINVILTAEDIDDALKICDEIFCDNNFSLILKCNLI